MSTTHKTAINHNYLSKLNSPEKLYVLGWLFTCNINKGTIYLHMDMTNIECMEYIKSELCKGLNIKNINNNLYLNLKSSRLYNCLNRIKVFQEEKCEWDISDNKYIKYFYRGYLESLGHFNQNDNNYSYVINNQLTKANITNKILDTLEIKYIKNNKNFVINGSECLDLFGYLYDDAFHPVTTMTYRTFNNLINWDNSTKAPVCYFSKNDENAVVPSKKRYSDTGYDISIISKSEDIDDKTALWDTGIKLNIPKGYWGMLVPRSSLSKSGYIMSNSFGVIDVSYTGTLKVPLTKVGNKDFVLPYRCAQLIFIPQVFCSMVEKKQLEKKTSRGEDGFGSTG